MATKFYERLSNDLTQLLENPIDYNVTIEVGEEPDKQIFKAHSYILQSRNSYFQKKLNEISFNENHIKVLKMSNISIKIFNIIIKYIYGGIISSEKLENSFIFDLLITSNELNLDELVEHLQTHFVNNNASWLKLNFSRVYQTSYQVKNFNIIQDYCNNIIAKYPNTIFESENFQTLPEYALISIIKKDDLQLEESKIWQYVIQWGKAQNPTLPVNLKEWTSDNFLTLKTTLKQCLLHIRFFSISSEDIFEMIFPYQQILEPELWLDINKKIMAPNKPISSAVLPPRKISNVTLPTRTTPISLFSNIITDEHTLEISSWIDRQESNYTENNPYEFKLLVRGSRDGFDVKTIYEICDKVSNTVIVLKVKDTGEILGGYNPCKLDKNKNKWIYSQGSFAFSLKTTNLKNSILSRVKNFNKAIANYPQDLLLYFGKTLCLRNNLKTDKKCHCLQTEFSYDKLIRFEELVDNCLEVKNRFNVEEYEVFEVSKKR
ncbi:hypothetical protein Glove_74g240 [Diversispora epigaea]|uniref:BTB domain-containing protein n=1 Tax=Diversispora epigaea TaxID=1348612 RepID=A0A397JCI6_9GLOM|nr:hypothetical protein Glove_74g240 [Diversispora epigaea]